MEEPQLDQSWVGTFWFCMITMGCSLEQMVQIRLCVAVEMVMFSGFWFPLLFVGHLHLSDMQNLSRWGN